MGGCCRIFNATSQPLVPISPNVSPKTKRKRHKRRKKNPLAIDSADFSSEGSLGLSSSTIVALSLGENGDRRRAQLCLCGVVELCVVCLGVRQASSNKSVVQVRFHEL